MDSRLTLRYPLLGINGYNSIKLTFATWFYTELYYDQLIIGYSIDGGSTWQEYGGATALSGVDTTWDSSTSFTISNTDGHISSLTVRFRFVSDATFSAGYYGVYLDNILVQGDPKLPNLTWTTPSGWDNAIVVTPTYGSRRNATVCTGQTVYTNWAIINNGGPIGSTGCWVYYKLDGVQQVARYVSNLDAGQEYYVTEQPPFPTVNTTGTHALTIDIDPEHALTEGSDSDNTLTLNFTWTGPDIQAPGSMTVDNQYPRKGQRVTVTLTTKNSSVSCASSAFRIDFYEHGTSPPTQGATADTTSPMQLTAGQQLPTYFNVVSQSSGTLHLYAYLDGGGAIGETNEGNNVVGPLDVTWTDSVSVSGTIAYDDSLLGANQALRCARIQLYDTGNGTRGDSLLASTYTDASGRFGPIRLSNVDTHGGVGDQRRLDVYVRAYCIAESLCLGREGVGVVHADSTVGSLWAFNTTVTTDMANGAVDLGVRKPTSYGLRAAMHMYTVVLRIGDWVLEQGYRAPSIFYNWAPGNEFDTAYDVETAIVNVNGKSSFEKIGPDEYDDRALRHEYGHHVAQSLGFPLPLPAVQHAYDMESLNMYDQPDPAIAWSEGWAVFFACMSKYPRADSLYEDYGDSSYYSVDEEQSVYHDTWTSSTSIQLNGETWETCVAGLLWDVYDPFVVWDVRLSGPTCRDSIQDGVANIWSTVAGDAPHLDTVTDFCTYYAGRYANPYSDPREWNKFSLLYCNHGMTGCAAYTGIGGRGDAEVRVPLLVSIVPTPTAGAVTLSYSLPSERTHIRLDVFDSGGRWVRCLVDRVSSGGETATVTWDARSSRGGEVPSGVYSCVLSSSRGRSTRRVTVVR